MHELTRATPGLRRALAAVLAIGLSAGVLAACGGDDNASSSSSGASGASATAASGTAAPKLTGAPIKTMTVASVNWNGPAYPNILATAKLYEKYINDNGGIHGHPLQVVTCDDQGDPNQTATCGRKALTEHVVAVVGSFTITGDRIVPVLEKGDTSWFGLPVAASPAERNNPISFEIGSGVGTTVGMAKQGALNCKKPALVTIDTPTKSYTIDIVKNVLAQYNVKLVKTVAIPLAATDYSPQAAQAVQGTDCLLLGLGRTNEESFLPAFAQSGGTQRLFSTQGNLNANTAAKFPKQTQNAITSGWYPDWSAPPFDNYRKAIETYKPEKEDWEGGGALGTWTGYTAFKDIADKITGPIDNKSFLAAANKTTALNTDGMTPVLDLSHEWAEGPPSLKRAFNRAVSYSIVKDGKFHEMLPRSDDLTDLILKTVKQ